MFTPCPHGAGGMQAMLSADCPDRETGNCTYLPLTAFAPTNSAFVTLASSLNMTVKELLALPEVRHFVPLEVWVWGMDLCLPCAGVHDHRPRRRGRVPKRKQRGAQARCHALNAPLAHR